MISYNPKEWLKFVFQFRRSDTMRRLLPLFIFICIYATVIAYLEMEVFKLSANSNVKGLTIVHNLLGFVISMLLVFRTNTAYDRWWEGRKLWGGLVNSSRSVAIKLNSFLPIDDQKERTFFKKLVPLFARELKMHLQSERTAYALDSKPHPEIPDFDTSKHVPNQVASVLMGRVNMLYHDKRISGDQLILLNNELQSFTDICGACERIKNTPIPYSYSAFIKKFISIYVLSLPFGYVFTLGYLVVPVVAFVFYVLASLELIAEEIEDPFGKDENDLPMDKLGENIKRNVEDIL